MNTEENEIKNKVAGSGLVLIDLEEYYPTQELVSFDLKPFLFMEMVLKEKDFRAALKLIDWKIYESKAVYIHCSVDAIIPVWAFMLVAAYLTPVTSDYCFGNDEMMTDTLWKKKIERINVELYQGKKVLVKGCSDKPVPVSAFIEISKKILPVANSLMYGEACSNVPVFKLGKML